MSKLNYILDTDVGSAATDALALLLCLKMKDFSLKAITTLYNCAELRAKIAKKLVYIANRHIDVGIGEDYPISGCGMLWKTGLEGFGVLTEKEFRASPDKLGIINEGIDFLIELINRDDSNYNIISIGPLTNIAIAIQKSPKIINKISRIWSMAAGITFIDPIPPNFPQKKQEYKAIPSYNIRCDINAAKLVLNSGIPITFIGNDLSPNLLFNEEHIDLIESEGSPLNRSVSDMIRIWTTYRSRRTETNIKSTSLLDALVVAEAFGMKFTERIPIDIRIEATGESIIKYSAKSIYEIAYRVKARTFLDWYLKQVL